MSVEGGCYCGELRYNVESDAVGSGQCHCRECQYISGGGANYVLIFPADGFSFIKGEPKVFSRPDLAYPVDRYFCEACGTHLLTKSPHRPDSVIVKVGSLDNPAQFKKSGMAIWVSEKQDFHHIEDGVPSFSGFPE